MTEVRHIIRNEELSYTQRVEELRSYVTEIGLPIPEKPKSLAAVRRDDIRVGCWMAVMPKAAGGEAAVDTGCGPERFGQGVWSPLRSEVNTQSSLSMVEGWRSFDPA